MSAMNVKSWVEVFEAIGIDQAMQTRWHQEFERRHPDGHQAFLEWLGLDAAHVERIRRDSRPAKG